MQYIMRIIEMISLKSISYYISMILPPICSGDVDFTRLIVNVNVGLLACLSVLRAVQFSLASVALASSVFKYSALFNIDSKDL